MSHLVTAQSGALLEALSSALANAPCKAAWGCVFPGIGGFREIDVRSPRQIRLVDLKRDALIRTDGLDDVDDIAGITCPKFFAAELGAELSEKIGAVRFMWRVFLLRDLMKNPIKDLGADRLHIYLVLNTPEEGFIRQLQGIEVC